MKKTAKLFFGGILVFLGLAATAQLPGTLNTNFGTNGFETFDLLNKNQYGRAIAVQPDGKALIGGMHEHTADKYDFSAGSITAALFLEEFAGDRTWVHLDIAGTGRSEVDAGENIKGGTGFAAVFFKFRRQIGDVYVLPRRHHGEPMTQVF